MRYRAALLFALLLASPAQAMAQHRADWMQEAKWGVMNHYLADWQARVNKLTISVDSWNGLIDHFDVESLAKQLQSVGARYYQISIGQLVQQVKARAAHRGGHQGLLTRGCHARPFLLLPAGVVHNDVTMTLVSDS